MPSIRALAESWGWIEPHWQEYESEVSRMRRHSAGTDWIATCTCGWVSMNYLNQPAMAARALWAHYLNPAYRRVRTAIDEEMAYTFVRVSDGEQLNGIREGT